MMRIHSHDVDGRCRRSADRSTCGVLRQWLGLGWAVVSVSGAIGTPSEVLDVPIVLTQIPVTNHRSTVGDNPSGLMPGDPFDGARLVLVTPEGRHRVLSQKFHSACDPEISMDGERVLFAGRLENEPLWGIWEMDLASGETRNLYRDRSDCRNPVYLGSLFTLNSPEPWTTVLFVRTEDWMNEPGDGRLTRLCTVKTNGTELRELTHAPSMNIDPVQLADGRVVFSSWRHPLAGSARAGRASLFATHIDGMDHRLYAEESQKKYQSMPCVAAGRLVFVEADDLTWDRAGQLAVVRERRPLHSYEALTTNAGNLWLYPTAWRGELILVSRRAAGDEADSGVVWFNLDTGEVGPVFDSPGYHDVQAKAVRPRSAPDGRSTVVDMEYRTGKLYGLDIGLASESMQAHLSPGVTTRLRILEGVPRPIATGPIAPPLNGTTVGRRLLGEAPIEADGSFHVQIPAGIPVLLQTIDEDGLALATCGWIWVQPRENLGCIGCHEDPELMPENRFVKALSRPANRLTLPAEQRRSVGFREDIVPILLTRCALADCHGEADSPLPLGVGPDQETEFADHLYKRLLAGNDRIRPALVHPGQARTSPLIWQVLGRNAARPWDLVADSPAVEGDRELRPMPPSGSDPLSPDQIRRLIEWVDLGAQWERPRGFSPATSTGPFTHDEDDTR